MKSESVIFLSKNFLGHNYLEFMAASFSAIFFKK